MTNAIHSFGLCALTPSNMSRADKSTGCSRSCATPGRKWSHLEVVAANRQNLGTILTPYHAMDVRNNLLVGVVVERFVKLEYLCPVGHVVVAVVSR